MLADSAVALILADVFFCTFLVVIGFAAALIFRGAWRASRAG